ncbi:hypothetical protein NF163_003191 [Salmonella enterica]|nr:hypothetical protein [Salmonella enterica subsp. enterica serovar Newport]EEH3935743.1 hypothetical protein [Salmonella enterica subsp. enterica serovar Newport]EJI9743936.1 hypothetical protein [Salmonella enterica]EJX0642162.1 hypothetical protein [Salmonella enterica]
MRFIFFFISLIPLYSNAFTIDKMIKFSDTEDFFLVNGSGNGREYLYVTLSELISDESNKKHEIMFDANNVTIWPIMVEPSEVIVSKGEQVKVKIVKNYHSSGVDRIFGVTFTPDVIEPNKEGKDKKINIPLGYKSWFIVPGKEPMVGTLNVTKGARKGDYIINNNTNKVMNIKVNYCNYANENGCVTQIISRPYAEKKVSLGSKVKLAEIEFYTISGDQTKPVKKIKL